MVNDSIGSKYKKYENHFKIEDLRENINNVNKIIKDINNIYNSKIGEYDKDFNMKWKLNQKWKDLNSLIEDVNFYKGYIQSKIR